MKRFFFVLFIFQVQFLAFSQGHICKTDYLPVQNSKNRMWGYMDLLGDWSVIPQYTKTYPFRGNVAVIQKGFKYGAINCNLKNIIPIIYDEIKPFVGSSGWVRKGEYWGLINDLGVVLLDPIYIEIKELNHYSSEVWVKDQWGLWGLYSKFYGRWLTLPKYSNIKVLNQNSSIVEIQSKKGFVNNETGAVIIDLNLSKVIKLAPYISVVEKDAKWGVVSDRAIKITNIEYDSIKAFSTTKLIVIKGEKQYLINSRTGKTSSLEYDSIGPLIGGAAVVCSNGKFGFINTQGTAFVKPYFNKVENFESLRSIVQDLEGFYVINPRGESIFKDSIYFDAITSLNNSKAFALKTQNNLSIADHSGIIRLNNVDEILDDSVVVRLRLDDKWHFYNLNTFELDHFSFDTLGKYSAKDNYVIAGKDDSFFIYKPFSKKSDLTAYDAVFSTQASNVFVVEKGRKQTLCNSNIEVSQVYDEIRVEGTRSFMCRKKNKWGLISVKGRILQEPKYRSISAIPLNLYTAQTKKEVLVLKPDGRQLFVSSTVDGIYGFREGYFLVREDNLYFLMSKSGKLNFKNGFEKLSLLYEGKCAFRKDNKWGIINKKGSILVAPRYSSYLIKNNSLVLID